MAPMNDIRGTRAAGSRRPTRFCAAKRGDAAPPQRRQAWPGQRNERSLARAIRPCIEPRAIHSECKPPSSMPAHIHGCGGEPGAEVRNPRPHAFAAIARRRPPSAVHRPPSTANADLAPDSAHAARAVLPHGLSPFIKRARNGRTNASARTRRRTRTRNAKRFAVSPRTACLAPARHRRGRRPQTGALALGPRRTRRQPSRSAQPPTRRCAPVRATLTGPPCRNGTLHANRGSA